MDRDFDIVSRSGIPIDTGEKAADIVVANRQKKRQGMLGAGKALIVFVRSEPSGSMMIGANTGRVNVSQHDMQCAWY